MDALTVRATAKPCSADDPEAFDVQALVERVTVLKDVEGEDVLIGSGRTAVRLCVRSGTLLCGPVKLTYELSGLHQLRTRLLALGQLEALIRLGRMPRIHPAQASNSGRRLILLRTLNALANHASVRSVAIALFGFEEVDQNWAHESDYLRARTRRLIRLARHLAAGGYKALLSA